MISYGVVCVILGLAIFVELRLVTDRRTDRQGRTDVQTHDDSIYHASIASHGKNVRKKCKLVSYQIAFLAYIQVRNKWYNKIRQWD